MIEMLGLAYLIGGTTWALGVLAWFALVAMFAVFFIPWIVREQNKGLIEEVKWMRKQGLSDQHLRSYMEEVGASKRTIAKALAD